MVLIGRVGDGPAQDSARDTLTFTADREGPVELRSRFPGELRADGSFATDRVPYRAISRRPQRGRGSLGRRHRSARGALGPRAS